CSSDLLQQTTLRDEAPGRWKLHQHDPVEGTPPRIQSIPLDHSPQQTPLHRISIAGPFLDCAFALNSAAKANGADATRKLYSFAVLVECGALAWASARTLLFGCIACKPSRVGRNAETQALATNSTQHRVGVPLRSVGHLTLPLRYGAAEPALETRRADARVCAGGEALIVQLYAEVECLGVCGHLPRVSVCAQESSDEFVETYRFGTGQLDCAVHRFPDCDVGQGISDVIRHDGLHQGR